MRIFAFCFSSIVACPLTINIPQAGAGSVYDGMIAAQAEANGVPVSLIHRVIMRESRYNPRAVSGGNYGLMQIQLGTARAMGYRGSAEGLLDPATNLTYSVRYLAGAYRAARGNESRAASLYGTRVLWGGEEARFLAIRFFSIIRSSHWLPVAALHESAFGTKRTLSFTGAMAAFDPERT